MVYVFSCYCNNNSTGRILRPVEYLHTFANIAQNTCMPKLLIYLLNLVLRLDETLIFERAAGLTYRILLAFFPLLLFLISLLAMLDVDESAILSGLFYVLPGDIAVLVADFFDEVGVGSAGVMSTALFFSVHNASAGFRALVRITGHSHGREDRRGFIAQVGFSLLLMPLFSVTLIIMLGLLVFRRQIWETFLPGGSEILFTLASTVGAIAVLVVVTTVIFKFPDPSGKKGFRHLLPGAVCTVIAWLVLSYFFGFAISNFTQYSAIYGSLSGIFVLILWLNAISLVFLVGNEINYTLLFDKRSAVV